MTPGLKGILAGLAMIAIAAFGLAVLHDVAADEQRCRRAGGTYYTIGFRCVR